MSIFKQASQQKLRIQTSRGPLTIEQLWDLPVEELDALAVSLEETYKNSKGKSFLTKVSVKDKTVKLKFDLVLDILNTKVEEQAALTEARENRKHNEDIMDLIAKKERGELEGKSVEELRKLLK